MPITSVSSDFLTREPVGSGARIRAVLIADETPESLNLTGADVEGWQEDDIIAVGSTLITPDGNFIAFEDGVFQAAGSGGGSGGGEGGGGSGGNVLIVNVVYDQYVDEQYLDKTAEEIMNADYVVFRHTSEFPGGVYNGYGLLLASGYDPEYGYSFGELQLVEGSSYVMWYYAINQGDYPSTEFPDTLDGSNLISMRDRFKQTLSTSPDSPSTT